MPFAGGGFIANEGLGAGIVAGFQGRFLSPQADHGLGQGKLVTRCRNCVFHPTSLPRGIDRNQIGKSPMRYA